MPTQLILLRDCSTDLVEAIKRDGPLLCTTTPFGKVYLQEAPAITPQTGRVPLPKESVQAISRATALSCTYSDNAAWNSVEHELHQVAIAIQLVKPSRLFLELWLQLDHDGQTELVARTVRDLGSVRGPDPYLRYQQHNVIEQGDVTRALGLLPNLARALEKGHGSWEHPLVAIHRAIIFFCQGYTVKSGDHHQFLWAAGIDCLFASKLVRKKQGGKEVSARLEKLFGARMIPYEAILIPINQKGRKKLPVTTVAPDVFRLRNAFVHGRPIPDTKWLGGYDPELQEGYAYQLLEQTEILLRLSLLKILEDPLLFETFTDARKLDACFS